MFILISFISFSYLFDVATVYVYSFESAITVECCGEGSWWLVSCSCETSDCSDIHTWFLISLSCCKMCLIESSVDNALVFSVFKSEDSLEDKFAIRFASFCTSLPISFLTAWIWFSQNSFTSFVWFLHLHSKSFNSIGASTYFYGVRGNMSFNLLVKVALFFDEGLELFITVIVITCWFQIQYWISNLRTSTVRRWFDKSILSFSSFFDNIPEFFDLVILLWALWSFCGGIEVNGYDSNFNTSVFTLRSLYYPHLLPPIQLSRSLVRCLSHCSI